MPSYIREEKPPCGQASHFALYVVVSVVGRDPSGARVGALQALLAREPEGRRPTIRAWLLPGFLPPQLTVASAVPSTDLISVRMLGAAATEPPLSSDDVLFWRNDIF